MYVNFSPVVEFKHYGVEPIAVSRVSRVEYIILYPRMYGYSPIISNKLL